MIRLIINGCSGKMGSILCEMASEGILGTSLAASVAIDCASDPTTHTYSALSEVTEEADCLIDFSNRAATMDVVSFCKERKLPLVIGTTGHGDDDVRAVEGASHVIPIFMSANMSVGVALMTDIVERLATALPGADLEIVETHHAQKVDAPSGTALMIAHRAAEARGGAKIVAGRSGMGRREHGEIGISAIRIGKNVGTHEVMFGTGGETITIKHEMYDRRVLAEGALSAAAFIVGQTAGLYGMKDLVRERQG